MTKEKTYFYKLIRSLLISSVFIALIVYIIDPYFQYRHPIKLFKYSINNQQYQNPGLLKNFDYDTIITGSSMVENFKPTLMGDSLNKNVLKVPASGATSKNINILVELAVKSQPKLNTIFWGLDLYALESPYDETRTELPMYLYDDRLINDINYLLNKDVILEGIIEGIRIKDNSNETTYSLDDYSYWNDFYEFSYDATMSNYQEAEVSSIKDITFYDENVIKNLDNNIIPLIEDNPQIDFIFFLPPYSILYWKNKYNEGVLDATLNYMKYTIETLLEHDNVVIFNFNNISEIVLDLDNYKDYTHYSAEINQFMLDSFSKNHHVVKSETVDKELSHLEHIVLSNIDKY